MAPLGDSTIIVTRDQFLAVLARMGSQLEAHPDPRNHVAAPPAVRPPPGLEVPPRVPSACSGHTTLDGEESTSIRQCAAAPPTIVQEGFQVLLRGLANAMAEESMMQVILEQASLAHDVVRLDFRPGGKALIKFSSLASVQRCIKHFNGRPWGLQGTPISALYVRSIQGADGSKDNGVSPEECTGKTLSASAPEFVMPSAPSVATKKEGVAQKAHVGKSLSAGAPVFVFRSVLSSAAKEFIPHMDVEEVGKRSRRCSDASTEAGLALRSMCDDNASESEMEGLSDEEEGRPVFGEAVVAN